MTTPRKRQPDAGDEEQLTAGTPGDLAERHRRTSKHRAPRGRKVKPRKRTPQSRGAREQRTLPFERSLKLTSWLSPEIFTRKLTRFGGLFIILLFLIGGSFVGYQLFSGSTFFKLRGVIVVDNTLISKEEIKGIVESVVTRSVVRADLGEIRSRILQKDYIREAEVTRMLPDMIKVTVKEREPVALARREDGRVVCVDRDGVMFGDSKLLKTKPYPPIIKGLSEDGTKALEENKRKVMAYEQLISELDSTKPRLSPRIDEVIFDEVRGVSVILDGSGIAVYLGREQYRVRLNNALDVIDAINRKDAQALNVLRISDAEKLISGAKIAYLNANFQRRVVVGLFE